MTTAAIAPALIPEVTPAVPVVPAVTPAAVVPETPVPAVATVVPEKWEASGNQLVDTIANGYLAKGGSVESFQALLDDVATTGTLTSVAKVELKKAFGDMAEALIPSIEKEAKANLEWVTQERAAVFATAGGEAAFTQMQEWAGANLDDKTRGFLSASLELGGVSAQMAVNQLKQLMVEKGATVTGTTHKVEGAPASTNSSISLAEFITENAKLQRVGDKAGIEALRARANASMAAANAKGLEWR